MHYRPTRLAYSANVSASWGFEADASVAALVYRQNRASSARARKQPFEVETPATQPLPLFDFWSASPARPSSPSRYSAFRWSSPMPSTDARAAAAAAAAAAAQRAEAAAAAAAAHQAATSYRPASAHAAAVSAIAAATPPPTPTNAHWATPANRPGTADGTRFPRRMARYSDIDYYARHCNVAATAASGADASASNGLGHSTHPHSSVAVGSGGEDAAAAVPLYTSRPVSARLFSATPRTAAVLAENAPVTIRRDMASGVPAKANPLDPSIPQQGQRPPPAPFRKGKLSYATHTWAFQHLNEVGKGAGQCVEGRGTRTREGGRIKGGGVEAEADKDAPSAAVLITLHPSTATVATSPALAAAVTADRRPLTADAHGNVSPRRLAMPRLRRLQREQSAGGRRRDAHGAEPASTKSTQSAKSPRDMSRVAAAPPVPTPTITPREPVLPPRVPELGVGGSRVSASQRRQAGVLSAAGREITSSPRACLAASPRPALMSKRALPTATGQLAGGTFVLSGL